MLSLNSQIATAGRTAPLFECRAVLGLTSATIVRRVVETFASSSCPKRGYVSGAHEQGWLEAGLYDRCAVICGEHLLNRNPLDLIERDFIAGAVIKLCCARALVRRHGLRIFKRASGFKIGRYARCPEGMTANSDA